MNPQGNRIDKNGIERHCRRAWGNYIFTTAEIKSKKRNFMAITRQAKMGDSQNAKTIQILRREKQLNSIKQ